MNADGTNVPDTPVSGTSGFRNIQWAPTGASGHDHKLPLACLKAAELVVVASGEPG